MDWSSVRALVGARLPLIRKPAFFTVDSADDDYLFVTPEETGKPRRLYRISFERAEALRMLRSDITPSELSAARITDRNASYIATIIRHLA